MTPRRTARSAARAAGFTLIELMIVVAVIATILALAAPSFRELIEMRRLRGSSAQLLTDVQFARSEAASRQEAVGIAFHPDPSSSTLSCYVIYTLGTALASATPCDCTRAAGSRCTAPMREIRTVQIEGSSALRMVPVSQNGTDERVGWFSFDPATGAVTFNYQTCLTCVSPPPANEFWIRSRLTSPGGQRDIRSAVNPAGRPRNCRPAGSTVTGLTEC